MRRLSILLALGGLVAGTLIVAWFGADKVTDAALSVGMHGFAALVVLQFGLFALLASAWHAACPDFAWSRLLLARAVRESGTNILPFSHVGGVAFGVQAAAAGGAGLARGFAANVVDVTFESVAQVAFIACGVAALVVRAPGNRLALPLAAGLVLMAAALGAFVWLQRDGGLRLRRVVSAVSRRVALQWKDVALEGMDRIGGALDGVYASPRRVACASLLHLLAWFGGAAWTWLALRLLGAAPGPVDALAIEGVVSGVLSLSFLVPGSLGVQEAAYIALGSPFGIGPDLALGLSLVRRAKDLAVGVPVLLVWQALALRATRRPSPAHAAPEIAD